ncbi:hypothetical protein B5F10_09195 [Anaerotruncus colihominis]|uniref:HlyC/CorC family transporter n=2 Tax=Anaerotruncus colihominis TaxID=169435 RepID=A0A1Y4MQD0_9FIRM|nr:hypothetical protein B5F11_10405 [Anaerotruncus colihominis]OUP73868.1 hypothetical protein B5F10_09195 [Anaerotruncus colihominis]
MFIIFLSYPNMYANKIQLSAQNPCGYKRNDRMMDPYPSMMALLPALLSALLCAGRTALTVLKDQSVKKMASSEDRRERSVARLLEKPAALLDGVKLACLFCNAAVVLLVYNTFSGMAVHLLQRLFSGAAPAWAVLLTHVLVFIAVVFLLDVLCTQLPYRAASRRPRGAAFALVGLCRLAAFAMRPFAAAGGAAAELLSRLFGARGGDETERVTEEEIRMMVDVGNEKGAIEQSEKDMINNIFEFDDRNVSEVMTHRTDMTAVPKDVTIDRIVAIAIETGFSRIPVYDEDIDDIMGIVYVKDLLCLIGTPGVDFDAQKYMRPALFVPESMSCVDLFAQFKQKKVMVAIVVDEYGGTAGIASMEDLLESIVGNIQDEYDDEDEEICKVSDGVYTLDGAVSIEDVERLFDIELDEDSEYDTIGGLLIEKLERIPSPHEHPALELSGVRFTVLLVEDRRIARIRAEKPSAPGQETA